MTCGAECRRPTRDRHPLLGCDADRNVIPQLRNSKGKKIPTDVELRPLVPRWTTRTKSAEMKSSPQLEVGNVRDGYTVSWI